MDPYASATRKNDVLILLGIFFFQLIVSAWVMSQSDIVCIYDESARRVGAYVFMDGLLDLRRTVSLFFELDLGQGHPHFVEWVAGLTWGVQKLFGRVEFWQVILGTNAVFGLVLILSVYGLAVMIYGRRAGLLAAFMVSMLPVVFAQSRVLMLDYPLMCMVTFTFYLLYKTQNFSSLMFCCLFGVVAGLTQWTKGTAFIFVGVPWFCYFLRAYLSGPRMIVVRGAFVSTLIYAAMAGSIYLLPHNLHVFSLYQAKAGMFCAGSPAFFYWREIEKLVGRGFFWISVPFLLSYLMRLKERDLFLFFWLFILLALFSASPNKALRFLLPLMPAFALIVAGEAVMILRLRLWGGLVCGLLIVALSIRFYVSNTSLDHSMDVEVASVGRPSRHHDGLSLIRKQLVDFFYRESSRMDPGRRMVYPLFNAPRILDFLKGEFFLNRMPFYLEQPLQYDTSRFRRDPWGDRPERILQADYVLMLVGPVPWREPENFLGKVLRDGFSEYQDRFEKLSEIHWGDSLRIDVYKKRAVPPK